MKTTSKILSILLVLSMVIAMLPGMSLVSQAADEVVLNDVTGMYAWVAAGYPELDKKELAINDAKDFRHFQQELGRFGRTFEGYTIYLTADLVLNEDWDSTVSLEWEKGVLSEDSVQTSTAPSYTIPGVGTKTENASQLKRFGGIFDGMGHSVSGLYLNQNSGSAGSLFGQVIGSAEVKNLAVLKSYFANGGENLTEAKPLAGFFTKVPSGTTAKISNCYVDIDLYEKSTSKSANIQAMFGGLVGYCAEQNLGLQLHLSQTQEEVDSCLDRTGLSPAELLSCHGFFNVPVTAAGCAYLSDEEQKMLGKKKATAVALPLEAAKSGRSSTPILDCVKNGMNVALGTGGAIESGNLDMFEVLRGAAMVARTRAGDADKLPASAALMMATVCGARAQGRAENTGMLKVGFDADLCLVDFSAPHLMPCHNVLNALCFSAKGGDVAMTMVRGKILYQNGQFPTIDLKSVVEELTTYAIPRLFSGDKE